MLSAHHLRQQALYERRGWRYVPIAPPSARRETSVLANIRRGAVHGSTSRPSA